MRVTLMVKQLFGFFAYAVSLIIIAVVGTLSAQPDSNVIEMRFEQAAQLQLQQMRGDIDFLMRAAEKHGLIEVRK